MTGARRELIEVGTGTAVVLALLVFLVMAYTNSRAGDLVGYDVLARFSRVDGVAIGTEVRAAGIPVGRVVRLYLDENRQGVLVLHLDAGLELDSEASAAVATDSLFGQKFVQLDVGGGDEVIEPGGEIIYTESSLIVDDLLELIIQRARDRRRPK